jgi:sulfite reductase alpha subunit-like flavoprotein
MESSKKIKVVYASQTGTAEQEAKLLNLQLLERGYSSEVMAVDEHPMEAWPDVEYAIFLISTTGSLQLTIGQGEAPDNMKEFWEFLLINTLPENCLENLKFTVFGFGDSNYKKYNAMARMLFQRLGQLGARSFLDRGLGDDQAEGGYNLGLYKWKKTLLMELAALFVTNSEPNEIYDGLKYRPNPTCRVEVVRSSELAEPPTSLLNPEAQQVLSKIHKKSVLKSHLVSNKRMTSESHYQDVREVIVKQDTPVEYRPGDVCTVHPSNSLQKVQTILSYFKLLPEDTVEIINLDGTGFLTCSAKTLFGWALDLSSPTKFFFFKLLYHFCPPSIYKDRILEMGEEKLLT